MRFKDTKESEKYYLMCQDKCKLESENDSNQKVMCTGEYVDCDGFGGYDPRDPCNQTCI